MERKPAGLLCIFVKTEAIACDIFGSIIGRRPQRRFPGLFEFTGSIHIRPTARSFKIRSSRVFIIRAVAVAAFRTGHETSARRIPDRRSRTAVGSAGLASGSRAVEKGS